MDRLMQAGLAALRTPQKQHHGLLARELRRSADPKLRRVGTSIELRWVITLGHIYAAEALLEDLVGYHPEPHEIDIGTWVCDNVRGILHDDGHDAEQALIMFDRAATYAGSVGLAREEQMSRQNVVRTATRFGRSELIKSAAAYLGHGDSAGGGTHEALGEIFENLGDWDSALWHYGNSERIDVNAVPRLGRARVYLATGKPDLATDILASLEPVAPDDVRTRSNTYVLAAMASLDVDLDRSRSLAMDTLAIGDSHGYCFDAPDARLTLAECELRLGNIEAALSYLEQADSPQMLVRDRMRCLDVRAKALWLRGSHKEALAQHTLLRRVWDDLDEMRSLLWETYRDLVRAQRESSEVTKLGPINDDLRVAGEAMHVTAAQTGHDLRSGLAVIKLAMSVPLEEPMRRIALSAIDQMSEIVEQVQWASTVEDAQRVQDRLGDKNLELFDFGKVVRQSVEQLRPQVERKQQELIPMLGDVNAVVRGHRILAVQVLNNLIENAMHYTPEGGAIEVRLTEEFGSAVLEVIDDGVGIPEGEEERIFRAFVRLRQPTSGESSTGLGLYIVRSSLQRLQGAVTATRRDDKQGSIFRVSLPIAQGTAPTVS